MKLNFLKILLQRYDNDRDWIRKIFGDEVQIKALKEFIRNNEESSPDPDISFAEYQQFLDKKGHKFDLTDHYLNDNNASARLFKRWAEEDKKALQLVNIKLDLKAINLEPVEISTHYIFDSLTASMARHSFLNQSDNRKALSPMRFWKQPQSLYERCMQFIACKILQDDYPFERKVLPSSLNEQINDYLKQAQSTMFSETLSDSVQQANKQQQEQFESFVKSLNL